jgi:hypothetical protein
MTDLLLNPVYWALAAFATSTAASCLSAVLPSDNPIVKILDVLAVNVGKAKNDMSLQRKE